MRNFLNIDNSAIATILGGMTVVLLLLASVFVYNIENAGISERRVTQILEQPQAFYGTTVSVEGDVEKVLDTQSLTVNTPGAIGDQLLVISSDSLEPIGGSGIPQSIFSPRDSVAVEGQVKQFNLSQVEEELGIDLDDKTYQVWEGKPFIYANDVALQEKE